jgi:hypothetical protein
MNVVFFPLQDTKPMSPVDRRQQDEVNGLFQKIAGRSLEIDANELAIILTKSLKTRKRRNFFPNQKIAQVKREDGKREEGRSMKF